MSVYTQMRLLANNHLCLFGWIFSIRLVSTPAVYRRIETSENRAPKEIVSRFLFFFFFLTVKLDSTMSLLVCVWVKEDEKKIYIYVQAVCCTAGIRYTCSSALLSKTEREWERERVKETVPNIYEAQEVFADEKYHSICQTPLRRAQLTYPFQKLTRV